MSASPLGVAGTHVHFLSRTVMRTFTPRLYALEARIAPATLIVKSIADSGIDSLRDALAKADALPGPDKIVFHLPPPPLNSENIIKLTTGELTSKGNVTVKGPGTGKLIIDGNATSRIFHIDDGVGTTDSPTTISGLSIVHGNAGGFGGGIYSAESLTLKNVVVSGSTANEGGGVAVKGSTTGGIKAGIGNSLITANLAGVYGGGLYLDNLASVTISKTTVSGNTAFGNRGGGIYAEINSSGKGIAITGCNVSGNSASYGGGLSLNNNSALATAKTAISGTKITGNTSTSASPSEGGGLFLTHGNTVITGSTISNNTAYYYGGGLEATHFTSLTISRTTISGNQTKRISSGPQGGGGVFIGGGAATPRPVKITGSHITDNRSARRGGGLFAEAGIALAISGSTFSRNHAESDGGGLFANGAGSNKVDLTVSGSTFSDNLANGSGGGIFASGDGVISITAAKVTGNVAEILGGGIYANSTAATNGLNLKNVTVSGNFAVNGNGGGLEIINTPSFHISGGSFTGNVAQGGGGIRVVSSSGSILGVTISGNAATVAGGGVSNDGPGAVAVQIAKVKANSAQTGPDVDGTFTFI
jgi:predicted outer membrane repeat protein